MRPAQNIRQHIERIHSKQAELQEEKSSLRDTIKSKLRLVMGDSFDGTEWIISVGEQGFTLTSLQGLINLDTIHKLQKNFFDEGAILTDIADCRTRNDVKEGIQIFFHVATQSPQDTSEVRS